MSGKQIGIIYFYLVSAAALGLIVVGLFNSINFLVNITQYEKYPLQYFEDQCKAYPYSFRGPVPATDAILPATPSAEDAERWVKECQDNVEKQRNQKRVEDLKNSLAFTLIGSVLFLIHFPQARKQSKIGN